MTPGPEGGQKRPEFEAILEQSIEGGLREVLGESGFQMVQSHYPLNHLSTDPVTFHKVLKDIFMENGAAIIEREIARKLLDKVGPVGTGGGRLHRWLATAASSTKGPGRASAREKEVLRQFVALATLPRSHPSRAMLDEGAGASEATSIELTSTRFASAFKKGS